MRSYEQHLVHEWRGERPVVRRRAELLVLPARLGRVVGGRRVSVPGCAGQGGAIREAARAECYPFARVERADPTHGPARVPRLGARTEGTTRVRAGRGVLHGGGLAAARGLGRGADHRARERASWWSLRVFSTVQRIVARDGEHYVYADVSVVCGRMELAGGTNDVLANPSIVVEVPSKSTEAYDRGKKWDGYQKMDTPLDASPSLETW